MAESRKRTKLPLHGEHLAGHGVQWLSWMQLVSHLCHTCGAQGTALLPHGWQGCWGTAVIFGWKGSEYVKNTHSATKPNVTYPQLTAKVILTKPKGSNCWIPDIFRYQCLLMAVYIQSKKTGAEDTWLQTANIFSRRVRALEYTLADTGAGPRCWQSLSAPLHCQWRGVPV